MEIPCRNCLSQSKQAEGPMEEEGGRKENLFGMFTGVK